MQACDQVVGSGSLNRGQQRQLIEGTVQIYQRPQHLGDASTTGRPPRKVVSTEQSKLALLCFVCLVRKGLTELFKIFEVGKTVSPIH